MNDLPSATLKANRQNVSDATAKGLKNQKGPRAGQKQLQVWIDEDMHAQFKAAVERNRSDMTKAVEGMISSYIATNV